jgi:PDZ domain
VVFADASCEPGVSWGFGSNDTTVIVEERSKDGGISRRVFDVFQAAYKSPTGIPTAATLREWGDLPLTDEDRWQGERVSWLSDGVDKPCVKDGVTETRLDDPTARTTPSTRERPTPSDSSNEKYVSRRPAPARGRLGVQVQQVSDDIADALGMRQARGALVASVEDGGSAKPGGIRAGDVIVMFDGYDIKEMQDLPRRVAEAPVGKDVQVVVIRKGKAQTMTVKVGQAPAGR